MKQTNDIIEEAERQDRPLLIQDQDGKRAVVCSPRVFDMLAESAMGPTLRRGAMPFWRGTRRPSKRQRRRQQFLS